MSRLRRLLLLLAGAPLWLAAGGEGPPPLWLAAGGEGPLPLVSFEGERVELAPAPGEEALLVHFWATWCPECVEELPALERAARACEGAPVRIAVVNVAESPPAIARFREAHGLALPTLRDPDGRVWRRFARGLPANLVWTREGRRVELGPKGETAWERALAELGCGAAAAR